MKILKPLLWFLIPTAVIWATYFLMGALSVGSADTPRFAGTDHYLRLFMQDDVFLTALANTFLVSILPPLAICIVAYSVTTILKAKPFVMYSVIFVISALTAMFAKYIIFDLDFYLNYFDILCAFQCGIVCCFVCFILNLVVKRLPKKQISE